MKLAVFSFDDGTIHDRQLTEQLNRCGVRATFNLNSGFFGRTDTLNQGGRVMDHSHVTAEEVRDLYRGHEVAVHTVTHPRLPDLPEEKILEQVENDRRTLEELSGQTVTSMAYPGGGENSDERVADILRRRTKILCARAYLPTYGLDFPEDPLLWHPTCHVRDPRVPQMLRELEERQDGLLFLWAHAYNLHYENLWERLQSQIDAIRQMQIPIVTMGEAYRALFDR